MKKEIKLQTVEITVVGMGKHILTGIANVFLRKKITGHVVTLRITGVYSDNFTTKEDFNVMTGDTISINVLRMKK